MSIVQISPDAPPQTGGVARVVENVTAQLPNVKTVVPKSFSYRHIVPAIVASYRASAIIVHHVLPLGTVAYALRCVGGPKYVIFFHGMDFDLMRRSAWKRWLSRRVARGAHLLVANSQALANEIEDFVGVKPIVVYPTPSASFFEAVDVRGERGDIKDVLRLAVGATGLVNVRPKVSEPKPLKVLSAARLIERKGVDRVIRALKEVPNVELMVVGDGPERGPLDKLAYELGVKDRVKFYGDVPNHKMHQYYKDADIFALPVRKPATEREGFGIVYLEAALYGVPAIATDVAGVNEAVLADETGLLVSDDDDAVVPALQRLVDDAALRARLGKRARARANMLRPSTEMAKLAEALRTKGIYV